MMLNFLVLLTLKMPSAFAANPGFQIEVAHLNYGGEQEVILLRSEKKQDLLWLNTGTGWVGTLKRKPTGLKKTIEGFTGAANAQARTLTSPHRQRVYLDRTEVFSSDPRYGKILAHVFNEISKSDWQPLEAKRGKIVGSQFVVETVSAGQTMPIIKVPLTKFCKMDQDHSFRCRSKMGWHIISK
jgi:hypothetical protein